MAREVAAILRGLEVFVEGAVKHQALELQPDWYVLADDARIRAAFARKIAKVEFAENSIKDVAQFLGEQAGVRFVVDEKVLKEEGASEARTPLAR